MEPRLTGATIVRTVLRRFLELSWAVRFAIVCSVGIMAAFALCWIAFGFGTLLGPKLAFAYFLGVTFTVGVGVGLMTLVFYSNRSGQDDAVQDAAAERQDPMPGAKRRAFPDLRGETMSFRATQDSRPAPGLQHSSARKGPK